MTHPQPGARRRSRITGSTALRRTLCAIAIGALIGGPGFAQARDYAIGPGRLGDVLAQYAAVSGVQLVFDPGALSGQTSAGLSGSYTLQDGFARLLSGSGYELRAAGSSSFVLVAAGAEAAARSTGGGVFLGTLTLGGIGGAGAVWDGSAETVFDTPGAVSALTTEQLEAFRGTSPADLLKSAPGVFSSESRASGGLDVNIRGLQGQGRVAITVDGTANSNSVYRGYQGVGNRSFVDPDFIAGVSVDKGPGATTGAIGGTVAMKTYGVDDIVPEGERVGVRLKFELSGNSSEPVGSAMQGTTLSTEGYAYSEGDVPGASGLQGGSASALFGLRGDRFDMVLGFARRKTGNYHAGSNGDGAGDRIACPLDPVSCAADPGRSYYTMGLTGYLPGEEVLNTATDNASLLFKFDWRAAPDHLISYAFNRFDSSYGETFPMGFWNNAQTTTQAPASTSGLASHALTWRWSPDSRLIDLTARVWHTDLDTMSPSSSGASWTEGAQWGVDIGNISALETGAGDVVLNYGVSYLNESTQPKEGKYEPYPQRWGTRESASLYLNSKWQPMDWLSLTAGLRHHRFETRNDRPTVTVADVKDSATDYSLGISADVGAGVQLFATYDDATRMPSMFESIGGMATMVSPDLTGERAKAWEVGGNLRRSDVIAPGDSLDLKLSYFNTEVSDYLYRGFTRSCIYEYNGTCYYWSQTMTLGNIDSMSMDGVELQAAWRRNSFSALLNATWYNEVEFCRTAGDCVNSSLASDYATNQIPPKYSMSLTLAQRFLEDRLGVSARFTRVGPRAADAEFPGYGAQPLLAPIVWKPYSTLDLQADYRIADGVMLYAAAENVADTYHVDPLNLAMMPGPGRTFRLGVVLGGQAAAESPADLGQPKGPGQTVDWAGFYMGGHIGNATLAPNTNDFMRNFMGSVTTGGERALPAATAGFGGVQLGWNSVLSNGVVLGVSADYAGGKVGSGGSFSYDEQRMGVGISDIATIGVRAGYAREGMLFYGMVGLSSASVESSMHWFSPDRRNPDYTIDARYTDKQRQTGLMLGAGMEYALNDKWSVFGEYRHVDFGKGRSWSDEQTVTVDQWDVAFGWRNDVKLDQIRMGLNYRF